MKRKYRARGLLAVVVFLTLGACASNGGSYDTGRTSAGKILACKANDQPVSSQGQCLQDDAACYQIANGSWCTGERGNVCPSGSSPLAAGSACPIGARCIAVSESLNCAIAFK